jgi:glycerol-3-phosphate dehydrogenase (NAD(P)+)
MWDRRPDRAAAHQAARENARYLPGVRFPDALQVTSDLGGALAGAELVLAVVPSQCMREVMAVAAPLIGPGSLVCCASKGVEQGTLETMDAVLRQVLPDGLHPGLTVLSGPSFAAELARGLPTAVVVAGLLESACHRTAEAFHGGSLRVYHSDDVVGVELGGALKNVMAIACGISDGLSLGLNARAGIITRGLAEIGRLAIREGANPLTLAGLAGMGDLVLTCTGDLSRNRRVGLALGQGRSLADVCEELGQVAEGVATARSARNLGRKLGVEMPITDQVYGVLYEDLPPREGLARLLGRARKAERD